jgi:hypothetical protein
MNRLGKEAGDAPPGQPVPIGYIALTAGYAVLYTAMLLTIAVYVFSRRDFK